jgi:hypothetical protein
MATKTATMIPSGLAAKSLRAFHNVLSKTGQLICMTKVTSDSWLIVGYPYDDALNIFTCPSPTQQCITYAPRKQVYNIHSNGANHNATLDEREDERADSFENSGQSLSSEQSDDSDIVNMNGDGAGPPYIERRRTRTRIHVPWLKSDEQRLLSYEDRMGRVWADIFKRLPNRTPGTIRTHYCMLQGK